jgi:hypothetical protein
MVMTRLRRALLGAYDALLKAQPHRFGCRYQGEMRLHVVESFEEASTRHELLRIALHEYGDLVSNALRLWLRDDALRFTLMASSYVIAGWGTLFGLAAVQWPRAGWSGAVDLFVTSAAMSGLAVVLVVRRRHRVMASLSITTGELKGARRV